MTQLLYLVDTFSLVFQVYHAVAEMTGPQGQPTNAVFGFTRDLMNLIRNHQPTHLICALESDGPGVRNELYDQYKANRTEIPVDLAPQIGMILDVIEGFRVPGVSAPGWEADDVIATLAVRAAEEGFEVRIVTNDKDARQLIGPRIQLYNVRKNSFMDAAALQEEWGIRPDQVVDFQALVGDSVDNVPGVPNVGPKTASKLLQQYGSLEEILLHVNEISGKKLKENLSTYAEQALLSRQLVRLKTDLDLDLDWETARVQEPNRERLQELFTQFGFRRFAEEMRGAAPPQQPAAARTERKWTVIDTEPALHAFLQELSAQKSFCFDLETTGLDALQADIVGWAFSWKAREGCYVPVCGPDNQACLPPDLVLQRLRPLLENPEILKVNQNIKYDMLVLRRAGVVLQGIGLDPMIGDYLLDAGARSHGLDALAQKYLKHQMIPISSLIGTGKVQKKMFEVDIDRAAEYAAEDADVAWELAEKIGAELRRENLWDLYWNLERPLISVLAEMEYRGIRIDVDELKRQSVEITRRLDALIEEIYRIAGREFNIGSPKQLSEILFNELKLPVIKKTKTGASTDQDVLEKLAIMHELPAKIIDHRHLSKLKGTYLDALPNMVNPETGRIHASFSQVVAATGRLSCSDPNLQNIPIRTEEGRRVRKAFIPAEPGWKLVGADYSQIELRMLAHFSHDPALVEAFRSGADIHTAVASEVFNVSPEDVTPEQRRIAKAVNFGVIYGQSPFGLSESLGIPQTDAAMFIDEYFLKYAGVDRYLREILEECSRTGYARTILGRRRPITGIRNESGRQRNLAERTAINTVVQGSAADLIKRAMINVAERLRRQRHPGAMLLQIHDELVFETPAEEVNSLIDLVREEMQNAMALDVPLVVDVSTGDNWYEAK